MVRALGDDDDDGFVYCVDVVLQPTILQFDMIPSPGSQSRIDLYLCRLDNKHQTNEIKLTLNHLRCLNFLVASNI